MDELEGTVEKIYIQKEDGYTVIKLKTTHRYHTLVGSIGSIHVGDHIRCTGTWHQHPHYGPQLHISHYQCIESTEESFIERYLASGIIKGIGPSYAKKIVARFGQDTFKVLDETPQALAQVPGLGHSKWKAIAAQAAQQKTERSLLLFLQKSHVSVSLSKKIHKALGSKAMDIIQRNPFSLARLVSGIGFTMADQIAQKMGYDMQGYHRVLAGIEHLLHEKSTEGHTYYPLDEFLTLTAQLLQISLEQVCFYLPQLTEEKNILIQDKKIWLKNLFVAEQSAAYHLLRIAAAPCLCSCTQADIETIEKTINLSLATHQKQAVLSALNHKVQVITGGPGTGKSTITYFICHLAKAQRQQIILAAPTGRAAKRLSEVTRHKASTIHALLQFDFKKKAFRRNKHNPLVCDFLIIDECSMIDVYLLSYLLAAIPSHCTILFVGDMHQLPSIGPGNILKDIIESKLFAVSYLHEIFRQAQGSHIITNAHAIQQGQFPQLKTSAKSDFFFIQESSLEKIVETIIELHTTRLPKAYGFHPLGQIQVLTPMRKGIIGIDALNVALQAALNPNPSQRLDLLGRQLCVGDKIMQIKNNYNKEVYNGDMGFITAIDYSQRILEVTFDEKKVLYHFEECEQLVLSYATSVHKYQGSEAPCVIIPIHTTHYIMLQRNLLYTAVTRGKKLVILIGTTQAIHMALAQNQIQNRFTYLQQHLLEQKK